VGHPQFAAMEIFPPDLPNPKSGTPEYAWRQQLAWTWAKAGYFQERLTGTGLQKRRIYALLQSGREALERIASDPALASFYLSNKRSSTTPNQSATFFQPPELVALPARDPRRIVTPGPNKNLKLVTSGPSEHTDDPSEDENSSDDDVTRRVDRILAERRAGAEGRAQEREDETVTSASDVQAMVSELRGLPVFFERITSVLERMNDRLVKVEKVAQNQSEILSEALSLAQNDENATREEFEALREKEKEGFATRDEIATALAEMTQAFLRDNPQILSVVASLKRHEDFHVQLAAEIVSLANIAKKGASVDEAALAHLLSGYIGKTMGDVIRTAVGDEVTRALSKEIPKVIAPVLREVISQEIGPGLTPIMESIARSDVKFKNHADALALSVANSSAAANSGKKNFEQSITSKIDYASEKIDARIALLEKRFEEMASGLDVGAIKKLAKKLEAEIEEEANKLARQKYKVLN
jgi:hypothetical protein